MFILLRLPNSSKSLPMTNWNIGPLVRLRCDRLTWYLSGSFNYCFTSLSAFHRSSAVVTLGFWRRHRRLVPETPLAGHAILWRFSISGVTQKRKRAPFVVMHRGAPACIPAAAAAATRKRACVRPCCRLQSQVTGSRSVYFRYWVRCQIMDSLVGFVRYPSSSLWRCRAHSRVDRFRPPRPTIGIRTCHETLCKLML